MASARRRASKVGSPWVRSWRLLSGHGNEAELYQGWRGGAEKFQVLFFSRRSKQQSAQQDIFRIRKLLEKFAETLRKRRRIRHGIHPERSVVSTRASGSRERAEE